MGSHFFVVSFTCCAPYQSSHCSVGATGLPLLGKNTRSSTLSFARCLKEGIFFPRTTGYWISWARLSYRAWLSHPMPGPCNLNFSYPINQNNEHFGTKQLSMSHEDNLHAMNFTPKFIPSSFWGEMRKKIIKATATILCHMVLLQLNHNTSRNSFSSVTISHS